MSSPSLTRPDFSLQAGADRRRQQLIRVASHLIESEGVDAVQTERVAEIAGCSRPLVYRYFHGRDELLSAVLEAFAVRLDETLDLGAQAEGWQDLGHGSRGGAPALRLLSAIWDCVAAFGMGGWVLRTTAELNPNLKQRLQVSFERFDRRWLEPMTAGGLTELQASLVFCAASAMVTELLHRWRSGTLEREAALELGVRNTLYLVDGALGETRTGGDQK